MNVKAEDIKLSYGAEAILKGVSMEAGNREFVGLIGPNGSGKSTLLHILGGVDRPTSGKVFVNGTELHSLKEDQLAIFRRRQIGLVYQFSVGIHI